MQHKPQEAQKHRRKAVDVHCDDAENNRCFCCIFSFCKQQTQTEFAFRETKLPLHFNSVDIILIGNLLRSLAVCILLWSAKLNSGRLRGKGGLSAKSVRDIMTVFRSISVYAAREYGVREIYFTMPKTEQKKMEVLNADERRKLIRFLLANPNRTNAAVLLCLFTGLRVGELCGLRWEDIDLKNNLISVNRTVQRVNHTGTSEVIVGSPKSRSSVRTIPIPEFVTTILTEMVGKSDTYLITGTAKPTEPRTMQNRFRRILNECGVRIVNFHMIRHTYATVCVEHGFDPKTFSELLGHADASIALNRYVHSSMQLKREYVDRLRLTA